MDAPRGLNANDQTGCETQSIRDGPTDFYGYDDAMVDSPTVALASPGCSDSANAYTPQRVYLPDKDERLYVPDVGRASPEGTNQRAMVSAPQRR